MKNYERVVAIDHGYDSIKVFDGENLFHYKSKIDEINSNNDFIVGENTHKVMYRNKNYIVGEGAVNRHIGYDKTDNEANKVFHPTSPLKALRARHRLIQGDSWLSTQPLF